MDAYTPAAKFFSSEKVRNQDNADLFQRLVKKAFEGHGEVIVITGHHVLYQFGTDISTEDEIPSADTLIFDHGIMTQVFGGYAIPLMQKIAAQKPYEREATVLAHLNALETGFEFLTYAAA